MTEEQKPIYYRPAQVAKMLNVSVKALGNMRRQGKIEGDDFGNITLYTEEQIKNARVERDKPGPKKGVKRGAKQSSNSSNAFSPQWHISGNEAFVSSPNLDSCFVDPRLVGV